jgi:type IV secretory pathway VirB10-like protein
MLFGYINSDEALKLFDKYKKKITEDTEILESTLTDYDNATLTKSKLMEIKKIQADIFANINEIKTQMDNFVNANNTQSIKNAVTIYIDRLLPLNKSLIEHKYKASFVEYNDTTQEYHLIQKENTINSLELCFESNVISFQISSYLKNENVVNQPTATKKKKPENEEKEHEKDEKKQAKKNKEREKEEKKKAKEDKEQAKKDKEREKEEKKKAKEDKEREKEEKKKAKEDKKKNKQTGGNDDSSSDDDSSSSSSSSSEDDDSSDEEEEFGLLEHEPALTEYEEPLSA